MVFSKVVDTIFSYNQLIIRRMFEKYTYNVHS
jgi:hypothetical protein